MICIHLLISLWSQSYGHFHKVSWCHFFSDTRRVHIRYHTQNVFFEKIKMQGHSLCLLKHMGWRYYQKFLPCTSTYFLNALTGVFYLTHTSLVEKCLWTVIWYLILYDFQRDRGHIHIWFFFVVSLRPYSNVMLVVFLLYICCEQFTIYERLGHAHVSIKESCLFVCLFHLLGRRDYRIGSNFWKFYLIRIGFTLGEVVSLVKVFRLFRLEQSFFGVQSVDTLDPTFGSFLSY
jgi:hypothetical protein